MLLLTPAVLLLSPAFVSQVLAHADFGLRAIAEDVSSSVGIGTPVQNAKILLRIGPADPEPYGSIIYGR